MTYVGGTRVRIIQESFYRMLQTSLTDLEWFNPGRYHAPIDMVAEDLPFSEEIPLNTLAVSWGDAATDEAEMGSTFSEHVNTVYVDFYAENDSVGQHLIYDVQAICQGKITLIGRNSQTFPVYDYFADPSPLLFFCEMDNILVDKARNFPKPYLRHWWSLQLTVSNFHADDTDY